MTSTPRRRGIRPEPPPFRLAELGDVTNLTPYMARVTLVGRDLVDLRVEQPASSVRLWVPGRGSADLPEIHWDGNRYRLTDGGRPIIRTFTPLNHDPAGSLKLEVVLHDAGAITQWLGRSEIGSPVGVSEPGRGYTIDRDASSYVLLGDESALPAIKQLVGHLDSAIAVQVAVEVRSEEAVTSLPPHPHLDATWAIRQEGEAVGEALLNAIGQISFRSETRVWAAGEAGAMYSLRQRLSEEFGLDRKAATVRGYWKHGR